MPGRPPDPAFVPLVEMRDVTKRFPGVVANDHVSFDVRAGEVHTLFGENGAGKSTLMRVLYGLYRPDEGEIWSTASRSRSARPPARSNNGIGMIHQHFMLVDTLTVAENVALGSRHDTRTGQRSRARVGSHRRARREVRPQRRPAGPHLAAVGRRAAARRDRSRRCIAMSRCSSSTSRRPSWRPRKWATSSPSCARWPRTAGDWSSSRTRSPRSSNCRTGSPCSGMARSSVPCPPADASRSLLVEMMVGHQLATVAHQAKGVAGSERLVVTDLRVRGDRDTEVVRGCSFTAGSGEVVGDRRRRRQWTDASRRGDRRIARAVGGTIRLKDTEVAGRGPAAVRSAGLGYVPEERMRDGVVADFSVARTSCWWPTAALLHPVRFPANSSHPAALPGVGRRVRREDTEPGHPREQPLRRQHPEADHGARVVGPAAGPAGRPTDQGDRRVRIAVHPPAPHRAA